MVCMQDEPWEEIEAKLNELIFEARSRMPYEAVVMWVQTLIVGGWYE